MFFIGLEVSLAKTAVCVVDRDGGLQWQGKIPSEPGSLIKRLEEWAGEIELVGIEACPLSEWLHRWLREAGLPVVRIESRQAQRFLSSRLVKTDKNDARGIAEMMRLGHYRPVHVKSPAAQSMRTMLAALGAAGVISAANRGHHPWAAAGVWAQDGDDPPESLRGSRRGAGSTRPSCRTCRRQWSLCYGSGNRSGLSARK